MKKQYTKKQIQEAISYWEKQLKTMNEDDANIQGKYLYITKNNPSFNGMVRKVGASGIKKLEDPNQFESLTAKLTRYNTCVPKPWEVAYQIRFKSDEKTSIKFLEQELFKCLEDAGAIRYGDRELFSISDGKVKQAVDKFLADYSCVFLA